MTVLQMIPYATADSANPDQLQSAAVAASVTTRPAPIGGVPGGVLDAFLRSASLGPSGLVATGEPGIGRTTFWWSAVATARERGFRVLAARPPATEAELAHAALADLLDGIDAKTFERLPEPQRRALDQVLLRAGSDSGATDLRASAAAFRSVLDHLTDDSPVLLAVDDPHWLDPSSRSVLAFATRRLSGRVGVLATVRAGAGTETGASWLQLSLPEAVEYVQMRPLSLGALHAVLSERLRRSFPRPTMVRIHEISAGNPFFALELARAVDGATGAGEIALPRALAELVQARIGRLAADTREVLLAAACLAEPTVELVARATGNDAERTERLLEAPEGSGIVRIDGHRLRFDHPLLAMAVSAEASPARRRAVHRRLAEIVTDPERVARHRALGTTNGDSQTLDCLDIGAELARHRGAPAAAAELVELALGLGGDTVARRMRAASDHFTAGDLGRARVLLAEVVTTLGPGPLRAAAMYRLACIRMFDDGVIEPAHVRDAIGEAGDDLELRAGLMVMLAFALAGAAQFDAAVDTARHAVVEAERLGDRHLVGQALALRVLLDFLRGNGIDEPGLRRAEELEDGIAEMPMGLEPSVLRAILLAWTGQFEHAESEAMRLRAHCIERGHETELMLLTCHDVLIDIWRGRHSVAALVAEDAVERAQQLGGDLGLFLALTMRAAVSCHAGLVEQARTDVSAALAAAPRGGCYPMAQWPSTILAFLEVSLGNYAAAADALEPLLANIDEEPNAAEMITASWVPEAAEALIQLGRLDDAERLIEHLERNGRRLDRAWMLAVGARCRAMLFAARGDLGNAATTAAHALREHDRLPMPFERARTQFLVGQLHRRARHHGPAVANLSEALRDFENLQTPLWAKRARAELARITIGPSPGGVLTPSEERVAELAAAGRTNRDVAAALFISPKTVEANLSRIYRKLDIHSRAELGQHMSRGPRNTLSRSGTAHNHDHVVLG